MGMRLTGRPIASEECFRLVSGAVQADKSIATVDCIDGVHQPTLSEIRLNAETINSRLASTRSVAIHDVAEQFENDGTIGSSIIKTVKRGTNDASPGTFGSLC